MQELFHKHCSEEPLALKVMYKEEVSEDRLKTINMKYYVLGSSDTMKAYMSQLKNAYYVAEDEKGEKHFISSKLYGHVFQVLLPGQFFSYAGKYYEVMNITAQNGVIVRRAADHMTNRVYYRQKQTVRLSNYTPDQRMGTEKSINSIRIVQGYSDISIQTHGYYQMNSLDDMEHSEFVSVNGIPERTYHNKSILRVQLPGAEGKVINTICIILSEMFKSIYPDTWPYIHVMSTYWDDEDKKLPGLLCKLEAEAVNDYIYFVEDSEIDLGLLVSIERNIKRYLEFVTEYLTWHKEKMAETVPEEEDNGEEAEFEDKSDYTFWEKVKLFFRRIIKKGVVPETPDKKKRRRRRKGKEEETAKEEGGETAEEVSEKVSEEEAEDAEEVKIEAPELTDETDWQEVTEEEKTNPADDKENTEKEGEDRGNNGNIGN